MAVLPDPLGPPGERHDVVIAANRLPVRLDGDGGWALSPGGLVTAMTAVMEGRDAVWIGWVGGLGDAADRAPPAPFGRSITTVVCRPAFVDPGGLPIDGSMSSLPRSQSRPPKKTARSESTPTTCS